MSDAMAGPKWAWRFGKRDGGCNHYALGYYSPLHWEFSDGCRGSWAKTPWGAVLRWNRWRNQRPGVLG